MAKTITAAGLDRLRTLSMGELRDIWKRLFGEDSRSRNKDYLQRRIAYRLQEKEFGGLSDRAKKRLDELLADFEVYVRRPLPPLPNAPPPRDPRLPPVGTVLVREFRGAEHQVTVLEGGFDYQGERFASLSEIARKITGTRWNGFGFFNLLNSKERAA
jgi:hypothetical protein